MKAVGIVRHIDDLGRLVIPKELRTALGVGAGSKMEFFFGNEGIMVREYESVGTCKECGMIADDLYGKSKICTHCLDTLTKECVTI